MRPCFVAAKQSVARAILLCTSLSLASGCGDGTPKPDETAKNDPPKPAVAPHKVSTPRGKFIPKSIK